MELGFCLSCVCSIIFLSPHSRVARVRETRITAILAHIGIGLSILMLPIPLTYIPRPVLAGLFVYMAVTSVSDNQLWERIQLVFIEQVGTFRYWIYDLIPLLGIQCINLGINCCTASGFACAGPIRSEALLSFEF